MCPLFRFPTERFTSATPYGLTSPFDGTVEASWLIFFSRFRMEPSSSANADVDTIRHARTPDTNPEKTTPRFRIPCSFLNFCEPGLIGHAGAGLHSSR